MRSLVVAVASVCVLLTACDDAPTSSGQVGALASTEQTIKDLPGVRDASVYQAEIDNDVYETESAADVEPDITAEQLADVITAVSAAGETARVFFDAGVVRDDEPIDSEHSYVRVDDPRMPVDEIADLFLAAVRVYPGQRVTFGEPGLEVSVVDPTFESIADALRIAPAHPELLGAGYFRLTAWQREETRAFASGSFTAVAPVRGVDVATWEALTATTPLATGIPVSRLSMEVGATGRTFLETTLDPGDYGPVERFTPALYADDVEPLLRAQLAVLSTLPAKSQLTGELEMGGDFLCVSVAGPCRDTGLPTWNRLAMRYLPTLD